MTDSLMLEAEDLIEAFYSVEVVQKYFKAKKIYEEDERLISQRNEIKEMKKNLPLVSLSEKSEFIKQIKKNEDEYYSSAIVITYNNLKEEVLELLGKINILFKY